LSIRETDSDEDRFYGTTKYRDVLICYNKHMKYN